MENRTERIKRAKQRALQKWAPRKESLALRFIEEESMQKERNMVRGSVHLCQLGENIGSEQNEERPVIVISNNRINSTSTNVKVIPLTKTLKTKIVKNRKGQTQEVPRVQSHYFLKKSKYEFLDHDSAAKVEEVTTVSKIRIGKHLGILEPGDIEKIDSRLKWVFAFK